MILVVCESELVLHAVNELQLVMRMMMVVAATAHLLYAAAAALVLEVQVSGGELRAL